MRQRETSTGGWVWGPSTWVRLGIGRPSGRSAAPGAIRRCSRRGRRSYGDATAGGRPEPLAGLSPHRGSDSSRCAPGTFLRLSGLGAILLLVLGLLLTGCAGMSEQKQRVVSGAAIGGTLACWPGAAIGAGVGYLVDVSEGDSHEHP